ncbi:MAG: putative DNA-binding domain-containing protein [Opitutaceae bacterium]|nr:putative DNA-binding domain-containing protein [Cephaloticoccus sp.]MCP5529011.1 putative DNA-binding domain-containing protein [Opitutaceae bacterium]
MARKKPKLSQPPQRAPERIRSTADLRAFQRLMMQAVTRPLAPGAKSQRRWADGRRAEEVVGSFAKANDRLSALERIEIYNRMYWFRTLDSLQEDLPGLRAVLGERKFARLIETYLTQVPSRSFTLRDLPARLERYIRAHPRLTTPHTALAADMAAFEWAQIECFDGGAVPPATPDDLADAPPTRLRLGLQPQIKLLALRYPVDDYAIALKRDALRDDASNAVERGGRKTTRRRLTKRPTAARTWLAIHRHEGVIYYKRLEAPAYRMLVALRDGKSLARAVAAAGLRVKPEQVQAWFTNWMQLGWFCPRK